MSDVARTYVRRKVSRETRTRGHMREDNIRAARMSPLTCARRARMYAQYLARKRPDNGWSRVHVFSGIIEAIDVSIAIVGAVNAVDVEH